MPSYRRSFAYILCGNLGLMVGCSASDGSGPAPVAGGGAVNGSAGQAGAGGGANPAAGSSGQSAGNAGAAPGGATSTAGAGGANGGSTSGGSAGVAGAAGAQPSAGNGGSDPGDPPAPRPLNVTVGGNKQITHTDIPNLNSAGLDTRAKQLGKLVVDLGVTSGGYQPWLGKRGFHSIGVSFPMCGQINTWSLGRDHDGDCRLNTFDGLPHGTDKAVSPADSISAHVLSGLQALAQKYPTEDWAYFLSPDGKSVRWTDVAFSGMSHGATTAPVIGKAVRLYRVVSRSGPRDNTCGLPGTAKGDFSRATPPWEANCPDMTVASWLDAPSATPMSRFYAFVGMQDVEYGDIMFAMERLKFPGEPVRWDVAGNVLTGTSRFYANAGHLDFLSAADKDKPPNTDLAMETAFGVPEANRHPAF